MRRYVWSFPVEEISSNNFPWELWKFTWLEWRCRWLSLFATFRVTESIVFQLSVDSRPPNWLTFFFPALSYALTPNMIWSNISLLIVAGMTIRFPLICRSCLMVNSAATVWYGDIDASICCRCRIGQPFKHYWSNSLVDLVFPLKFGNLMKTALWDW